jgi:hypothetical protein
MNLLWQPAVVSTRGEHVEVVHYGGAVAVQDGKVVRRHFVFAMFV